jgi:hypothetical protein
MYWIPRREVVQPKGLWCREGATFPWAVQVVGNERLTVGIVARVKHAKVLSIMM